MRKGSRNKMKVIILAYILSSLASKAQGKCDGVITVGMFADDELISSLESLKIDIMDAAKLLTTNAQQYFLAENFGGKSLLLEVVALSKLPEEVEDSDDARTYLNNFCEAQVSFKNGGVWDHAMLLTSKDLRIKKEENTTFAINGLSNLGSMCGSQEGKCSIIKANNLNTGVVTAVHEIGHSLGIQHDQKTECKSNPGIMTESLEYESLNWSLCSINKINGIFNENKLRCLMKGGTGNNLLKYHDLNSIPIKTQCELAYGESFESYSGIIDGKQVDVCKNLYCINKTDNIVKFQPGSPSLGGTVCGDEKKCWNQKCMDRKNFDPEETCEEDDNGSESGWQTKIEKFIKSIVDNVIKIVKDILSFIGL